MLQGGPMICPDGLDFCVLMYMDHTMFLYNLLLPLRMLSDKGVNGALWTFRFF